MNLMNTVEYIYREIMLCRVGINKILWVGSATEINCLVSLVKILVPSLRIRTFCKIVKVNT